MSTSHTGRKIVQHVTVPQLKLEEEKTVCVRITKEMWVAPRTEVDEANANMEPPTLIEGINLDDPKRGTVHVVAGAVLVSEIEERYPDGTYVGRAFEITMHAKKAGKKYRTYSGAEVEAE